MPNSSNDISQIRLAEVAARYPRLRSFFETNHINICCQGELALEQAATQLGFSLQTVIDAIAKEPTHNTSPTISEWRKISRLSKVVEKVEIFFHRPLGTELLEIDELFQILVEHHGSSNSELISIANIYHEMAISTQAHMTNEEENIFPLMRYLDYCYQKGLPMPVFSGGTIQVPIDKLEWEHVQAEKKLLELKNITHNFTKMDNSCAVLTIIYERLAAMQKSLKEHILVENQILNPMALKIEQYMQQLGS